MESWIVRKWHKHKKVYEPEIKTDETGTGYQTGKFIETMRLLTYDYYTCPVCGKGDCEPIFTNYCPNCGTRLIDPMKKGKMDK